MNLEGRIVLAHRGYFDKASKKLYRENSAEVCALSAKKDYISIIELDLRKSNDGTLYCYHGNFLQYCWYFFISKLPKTPVNRLEDILDVIGEDKSIFLDIKDHRISREDVLEAFNGRKFKEIILGDKSVSFLSRFRDMPQGFVKIMNGNIFGGFYDFNKLKQQGFKYYEAVFPWQITKRVVDKANQAGIEFRCSGLLFFSKESYWRKIEKYSIKHITSDFI